MKYEGWWWWWWWWWWSIRQGLQASNLATFLDLPPARRACKGQSTPSIQFLQPSNMLHTRRLKTWGFKQDSCQARLLQRRCLLHPLWWEDFTKQYHISSGSRLVTSTDKMHQLRSTQANTSSRLKGARHNGHLDWFSRHRAWYTWLQGSSRRCWISSASKHTAHSPQYVGSFTFTLSASANLVIKSFTERVLFHKNFPKASTKSSTSSNGFNRASFDLLLLFTDEG